MRLVTVQVQSLRSGSSGNALLIRGGRTTVLVDCGLAPRELQAILTSVDCALSDIDLVLLTHEHGDHARGLAPLLAAERPIVATAGTASSLRIPSSLRIEPSVDNIALFNAVSVQLLPVSHDAAEPCGFAITIEGVRCTLLTDIGKPDPGISPLLRASDLLIIEANHAWDRLRHGPYPARLKRRVASDQGHLSNEDCARWLGTALHGSRRAPDIWLAHLSRVNNMPLLALETVQRGLSRVETAVSVTPLPRRTLGPIWEGVPRPSAAADMPVQLPLAAL